MASLETFRVKFGVGRVARVVESEDVSDTNDVTDDAAMGLALDQARLAAECGEVPVGAIVVVGGTVVAARHNEREATNDPTAHAEILALRDAASRLETWRLSAATMYVTLEPCPMCAGAAWASRLGRIVFGAPDSAAGATGSLYNIANDERLNHSCVITHGVRADESSALLQSFFSQRRSNN